MGKAVKLREIYLASILVLVPLNIIDGFIKPYAWNEWLLYTIPFIGLFFFIAVTKNFKIDSIILGIGALLCIVFGDKGNITGAWFLYLFCYSWENKRFALFFCSLSLLIIRGKFLFMNYFYPDQHHTYFEFLKYLYGYYFIFFVSFYLTWIFNRVTISAGKAEMTDKERTKDRILNHLVAGSNIKTIAYASAAWQWLEIPLTPNAVQKIINKIKRDYNVNNLFQLGYKRALVEKNKLKSAELKKG